MADTLLKEELDILTFLKTLLVSFIYDDKKSSCAAERKKIIFS